MSTKTTFKRVALVAVAALGLGVLSVAPSSAVVSGLTVTVGAAGSSTLSAAPGYVSDSTTAATFTVAGLLDTANDSITVTFLSKSAPVGATAVPRLYYFDSTTPSYANSTRVETTSAISGWNTAASSAAFPGIISYSGAADETITATAAFATKVASALDSWTGIVAGSSSMFRISRGKTTSTGIAGETLTPTTGYVGAKFGIQLDSTSARIAGTYTYTVVVKSYNSTGTTGVAASTTTADVSIVVSATAATLALVNGTIDPSKTTAVLNAGAPTTFSAVDSSVAVVATAAATNHASIQVRTYTADSNYAPESVTATITGAGVVCNDDASVCGKSLTITGAGGNNTLRVRADGTAGTGSIVIKTTTVTFPAKTVTFFAKAAKTITLAANKPVISVGDDTDVIRATITDADGNVWGGAAYIYAATAADALIAGSTTPAACTYDSTYGYHKCPVSGIAKGTANFKVIDASTVALATATSASTAAVRVSTGVPTTAKISFDKATYAPGEKATVLVTILDADGLALPYKVVTAAFAAAPTTNVAFSTGGDTLGADVTLAAATSSTSKTTAGSQQYTVYMPYSSGDVTISATGSTGLAASGRVAVSATASVVNSSVDAATDAANEATDAANAATDAALAAADAADAATAAAQDASDAVAALSASVSKMIASLKAQITSLTNLVIKIQKKVRA